MSTDNLFIVYIDKIGENSNMQYEYDVYVSNTPDIVWAENWAEQPASACEKLPPEENTYQEVIKMVSNYELDLAQENDCFSMQDCIDGIIKLCWLIDDEDNVSLNVKFGENYEEFLKKIQGVCEILK